MTAAPGASRPAPSRSRFSLSRQMMLALAGGILAGWLFHRLGPGAHDTVVVWLGLVRDVFLHLIKVLVGPLVFASIVQGIASSGDLRKVGRLGAKALVYFEVATTLALGIGLLAVNLIRPGEGIVLVESANVLPAAARPLTPTETLLHVFPTSIIDALARNDVLQVVAFAVIFALAVTSAGEAARPVLAWCESLTQVMFQFANLVMRLAPVGVGAAIALTVAQQGPGILLGLGKLVITLYLALLGFVIVVLGVVLRLTRVPARAFFRAVREPFALAFATASSEAALPKALAAMERFGVPRSIAGFVLPTGYTFNLDGSTLYLAVASVFVAQAAESTTGVAFPLEQQLTLMLTLMITSKGIAAVPRASLVVLMAALQSFNLPLAGAALLLAVDALLDMARTAVNVLGNCLACIVVARWEGDFDAKAAEANFGPGTGDDPARRP